MATFLLNPTYPTPNRDVKIVVSPNVTGTNYFRIWATVAPTGSSIDNDIKNTIDPRNRFEMYSNNGGQDFPFVYRFDKGGKYTFVVQEYIKGSGYGGAFEGDPNGSGLEIKNGSEYTIYVYIGQKLSQSIGAGNNKASLNLWVWDSTIRATYKNIHGENTPSITTESPTSLVTSAIESDSVKQALLNLVDVQVSTAIGIVKNILNEFWSTYNSHLSNTTPHGGITESWNKLDTSLEDCSTGDSIIEFVNQAIPKIKAHVTNDNMFDLTETGPKGPGYGSWHQLNDRVHVPLFTSVSTLDEAFGAIVDLFRTYELHRVSTNVHYVSDDNDNFLSDLTPLMAVHNAFLEILASDNPPAPAAQSTGAQLLISNVGFKEI